MDVEVRAEQFARHRRAFDVPAGTPLAPRRIPGRFALLRLLPQHEVERVLLGAFYLHPLSRPQVIERLAGEPAVAGKSADRKIDVAVGRRVSQFP
ncbi:hypothetical protein D3C83_23240 [compost metagenome]